ncbi:hypothetical protein RI129_000067 [Pyrocoelia pectoralis]|uniref:Magnesium transporter protein 1 n=1 Tax=Pyrocoelia pectoralis TaxID=417401 RepID=A0AAN7UZE2_9COLE
MKPIILGLFLLYTIFFFTMLMDNPGLSMGERVQQLTDMANKKSILKFNGNKFRDFVKAVPRNYSVIIMFTAMAPQRQCMVCRHASDEFTIVANSFRYSQAYSNKLFFAVVDFDEGGDVFQLMRLNTAPVFIHFPPKGKPKNQDTMDIQRIGFSAESIAKWITERTDIQLYYSHLLRDFYLRRNNLDFLYNKNMWATGALFFCFTMVSGQMWNHIRGPPFAHKNQQGQVAIYMAPRKDKKKDISNHWHILVSVFFSLILSIFRSKTSGYPYSFLFK